jgi:NADPH:quinone reductase
MRAAVVTSFGGPEVLQVEERDIPSPDPDQVSIDIAYAGVNFAEVTMRRGELPNATAPVMPGLEVSGIVREVGSDATDFAVGDPVCAFTIAGGYAEVAVAPALSTHRLPDGDDATLRRGATLPTVVPTAWALINELARLRPDEDVLVVAAAGGIGTIAGQLARHAGAGKVYGIASTLEKAAYAKSFGYDDVFVESKWRASIDAATGARGVDVVLDSVGGDFRAEAIEVVAPMGRLVMFGNASGAPEVSPPAGVMRTQCKAAVGFSITGLTRLDPARARRITEAALRMATETNLRIDITEVLPLEDAWRAHEALEGRRTTGKLVLSMSVGSRCLPA